MRATTAQSLIEPVFAELSAAPVLVDLGASGSPPEVWAPIARWCRYVGFDPDQRDLHQPADGQFASHHVVASAVAAAPAATVTFHLTRSPYCSSTLAPYREGLADYLFSDLFEVEATVEAPATTLADALATLELERLHWFKADTQGTDLRLFLSLPHELRDGVLAVDVEPGLINAYHGEDLFVDVHGELTRQGFWMSRMDVKGTARLKRTTLAELAARPGFGDLETAAEGLRLSPAWCEVRYLRTLDFLANRSREDWLLAWAFAIVDDQPGFALDLACAFPQRFGASTLGDHLVSAAASLLRARLATSAWVRAWRRVVPAVLRRKIGHLRRLAAGHPA